MRRQVIDITHRLPKPSAATATHPKAKAAEQRLRNVERWALDVIATPTMHNLTAPTGDTWLRTALSTYWAATVQCDLHGVRYETNPQIREATANVVEVMTSDAR